MIQIPILEQKYVHPRAFYYEIKKCLHFGELSNEMIDTFHLISLNLSYKLSDNSNNSNILGAFSECVKYWKNFNPELNDNPFHYFNNLAKNGYMKDFNRNKSFKDAD